MFAITIEVTLSQQRKLFQVLWHLSSELTKWFLKVSYVVSTTSSLPLKVLCKVSSLVLPWKSPILKCPHVSSSSFQLYMTDPGLTIKKVPDTLQMLSFWKKSQDWMYQINHNYYNSTTFNLPSDKFNAKLRSILSKLQVPLGFGIIHGSVEMWNFSPSIHLHTSRVSAANEWDEHSERNSISPSNHVLFCLL